MIMVGQWRLITTTIAFLIVRVFIAFLLSTMEGIIILSLIFISIFLIILFLMLSSIFIQFMGWITVILYQLFSYDIFIDLLSELIALFFPQRISKTTNLLDEEPQSKLLTSLVEVIFHTFPIPFSARSIYLLL